MPTFWNFKRQNWHLSFMKWTPGLNRGQNVLKGAPNFIGIRISALINQNILSITN